MARKISRNKRAKGVEIGGTKFDPRRDKSRTKGYTVKQLESYVSSLSTFNGRKTQFDAGAKGAPLPRTKWAPYKNSEQAVHEKYQKSIAPWENVKLPGPGSTPEHIVEGSETIGQRAHKIRAKHPTAMNMGYLPPERQPFNVKDADSLEKLTKANKKRMTKKFDKSEHERAVAEFTQMVSVFKDDELNDSVQGLTKGQFDVLWNFTRFADAMSLSYHSIVAKHKTKQEMPQEIIDTQVREAKTLINWVKKFKI